MTTEIRSPFMHSLHQHHEYEVIIIDHGRYECRLNDALLRLTFDNLLIVKPGDWHQDICRPSLRYFGFLFRLQQKNKDGSPLALFHETINSSQQTARISRRVMWPIMKAIRQEANIADMMSSHVQHALLTEFFWRMIRALPADRLSADFRQCTSDRHFSAQLFALFRNYLYKKYSIREMARSMGMSPSSLCHKCKCILGLSPAKAFMTMKMDYALQYLTHSAMSVKEISDLMAFENPYHFSKVFKHHKGHPPSYYR